MPLWMPYDSWLDSKVADLGNAPSGAFAGSITCALFLKRFVAAARSWLHCRHLRLDADGEAGAAGRRRMPGGARALQPLERALWLTPADARACRPRGAASSKAR